ncbi:unnamed protein product [Periconia digitata]|uniref:Uncharacterized protein n=1 Tax=Periconia digitata TaxID=1303443 RepID=A0A9W4XRI5_9PLEO|nr:unnamed protein product [Periconia digitata]
MARVSQFATSTSVRPRHRDPRGSLRVVAIAAALRLSASLLLLLSIRQVRPRESSKQANKWKSSRTTARANSIDSTVQGPHARKQINKQTNTKTETRRRRTPRLTSNTFIHSCTHPFNPNSHLQPPCRYCNSNPAASASHLTYLYLQHSIETLSQTLACHASLDTLSWGKG